MSENKTKPTALNPEKFLNSVEAEVKRNDSFKLLELMKQVTKEKPVVWGSSMIGFGTYHYIYKTGREGDSFKVGFSPRKQYLAIYIMPSFENYRNLLDKLGKHKTSVACLYIKKLDDVNVDVLTELIKKGYEDMPDVLKD